MKISVIIPAHNEEKRIEHTLRAILAQDYPDFEVMVVDNGSTDRTADVARKFGVRVVSESRKGTMWACEAGRQVANGDIIVRMDADCLPEKDWLKRGAAHFNDSRVVSATGPYDYYDGPAFYRGLSLFTQKYIYHGVNFVIQKLRMGGIIIEGNSFMRAETLKKIGGFDTSIVFYGDGTDTAKRLSRYGWTVFDPTLVMKTSARRLHNEGVVKISLTYLYHFFKGIFSPTKNKKAA